ncbi:MAG TPA: hypothetical protein VIN04_14530 [Myxococcota bacterium]
MSPAPIPLPHVPKAGGVPGAARAPAASRAARSRARLRSWTRALLALCTASALLPPVAAAERGDVPVVELPPAACDVCTPGKPPPPPEVQERVRRINREANWRRQPSTGDTIPLGPATRVWLQRAWASGRLQPGVAQTSGSSVANAAPGFRRTTRQQARTSLASRSRDQLSDRRSTRDRGRLASRSRRGTDESAFSSSRTDGDTRSLLGTDRSANRFGLGSSFSTGMGGSTFNP